MFRRPGWLVTAAALIGMAIALVIIHTAKKSGPSWTAPMPISAAWPVGGRPFAWTVGLASGASILAILLGFPVGIHLGRRAGIVVAALTVVPLVIPPQVAAYVWRFTLDDAAGAAGVALWRWRGTSAVAAAWTLAAMYWPIVALPVAFGVRRYGRRLSEELATLAPPPAVFWRTVVPGLAPALVGGGAVFFLLALSNYGVPLMWNVPSQVVASLARLDEARDPAAALAPTVPLLLVVLGVLGVGVLLARRRPYALDAGADLRGAGGRTPKWDGARRGFAVAAGAVLLLTAVLPIVSVATIEGVLTTNLSRLTSRVMARDAYGWSLIQSALGASGAVVLGTALALVVSRPRFPLRPRRRGVPVVVGIIEVLGLAALFVPAIFVCLLLALGRRAAWFAGVYDSLWIFPLAYGLRYFYIPWRVTRFVRRGEPAGHRDVSAVLGLGRWTRARLALAGPLKAALTVSFFVVFALALGEMEIAKFVYQPARQPLAVFLDNEMHYSRTAGAMRWVLIVVMTEVAAAWLVLGLGRLQWRTWRAAI